MSDDLRDRVRFALDHQLHKGGLVLEYELLDALVDAVLKVLPQPWQPIGGPGPVSGSSILLTFGDDGLIHWSQIEAIRAALGLAEDAKP